MDEASGKPYWHDGTPKTTWDDPTTSKNGRRRTPTNHPQKMRKQSGYVFFQSQHREAARPRWTSTRTRIHSVLGSGTRP